MNEIAAIQFIARIEVDEVLLIITAPVAYQISPHNVTTILDDFQPGNDTTLTDVSITSLNQGIPVGLRLNVIIFNETASNLI